MSAARSMASSIEETDPLAAIKRHVEEIGELFPILDATETQTAHSWVWTLAGKTMSSTLAPLVKIAPRGAKTPKDELSVEEVAVRLGCSESWVYHHHKRLRLGGFRRGKELRFSAEAIERYDKLRRVGKT